MRRRGEVRPNRTELTSVLEAAFWPGLDLGKQTPIKSISAMVSFPQLPLNP